MEGAALERGTAIIDPFALRALDLGEHRASGTERSGFGLRRFIPTARADKKPILGDELFGLASMAGVRKALDEDFERYLAKHKASLPSETIGVGQSFDWQVFDRDLLYSARARFVLAGIVNRMDRAYVSPEACGEVRLIYRLTRLDEAPVGETANSPRLPMTLNVIMRARGGGALSCKEIAQRWLAISDWPENGAELASRLMAPGERNFTVSCRISAVIGGSVWIGGMTARKPGSSSGSRMPAIALELNRSSSRVASNTDS